MKNTNLFPSSSKNIDPWLCHKHPLHQKLDMKIALYYNDKWKFWFHRTSKQIEKVHTLSRCNQFWQFLHYEFEELQKQQVKLDECYQQFNRAWSEAATQVEQYKHLRTFAYGIGGELFNWRKDKAAIKRWFSADAVIERYHSSTAEIDKRQIFIAQRMADLCSITELSNLDSGLWLTDLVSPILNKWLNNSNNVLLRRQALITLHAIILCFKKFNIKFPNIELIKFTYHCSQDSQQPPWVQSVALGIIADISPDDYLEIAWKRLTKINSGDDFFIRHQLVNNLGKLDLDTHAELITIAANDPSAYVRQAVANSLPKIVKNDTLNLLKDLVSKLLIDTDSAVIMAAIEEWSKLPESVDEIYFSLIENSSSINVCRFFCLKLPQVYETRNGKLNDSIFLEKSIKFLTDWHISHPITAVRRYAAAARESIHLLHDPLIFSDEIFNAKLHKKIEISKEDNYDIHQLLRQIQAKNKGFGINIKVNGSQLQIVRDHIAKIRTWRVWHEFKNPATDKRQNISHLIGRDYPGSYHVASQNVAEVSQTKVPGEALHIKDEGSYRPYLPLLDHLQSTLDYPLPTESFFIYSNEGVTIIRPPKNFIHKLYTKFKLSYHFSEIAALRNWTKEAAFPPDFFIQKLHKLGFSISFLPHNDIKGAPYPVDPEVERFFVKNSAYIMVPTNVDYLWNEFYDYFYSIYQNSISQLLVFLSSFGVWFFGRHAVLNILLRIARNKIPVVIGGWGTRGKSGTERLKAALFNAMGYQVLSKTTGCEAMFLHGHAHKPLREIFLFRPYDKATIWEQVYLVRFAAKMQTDVMLWECMGLNPRYVDILQHQWMRDDLSTLTNCYPDHEDIQGPAGTDVPQVIARFIPHGKKVFTSEENMLPFLQDEADRKSTELHAVEWHEAARITQDVLDHFPYQEHPSNIALCLSLSREFGIPDNIALSEMADKVIPDLGVLKTYPQAIVGTRTISFINGCSANERHGMLSNWIRMNMTRSLLDDSDNWIVTVVNNRADRVARSQVFASILVNDIGADRHVLIGGNLDGLNTYIKHAFDAFYLSINWQWNSQQECESRLEFLAQWALRMRLCTSSDLAMKRISSCLRLFGIKPKFDRNQDLILPDHLSESDKKRLSQQWRTDCNEASSYINVVENIRSNPDGSHYDETSSLMWEWLSRRILVIPDYYISGQKLIYEIIRDTPPGLNARVMGIQNIKGTGLDFIYRWQAWDNHYRAINELHSHDSSKLQSALHLLAGSEELGLLEEHALTKALEELKSSSIAQTEIIQTEIDAISRRVKNQIDNIYNSFNNDAGTQFRDKLLSVVESLFDSFAAIMRRRKANKIYSDLANIRISHSRAIIELQELTKQQKGGWLRNKWPL